MVGKGLCADLAAVGFFVAAEASVADARLAGTVDFDGCVVPFTSRGGLKAGPLRRTFVAVVATGILSGVEVRVQV